MDRRRAVAGAAILVTVGAAAAITLPAVADDGPRLVLGPTDATATAKAPDLTGALLRDLGGSEEQVRTRMDTESRALRATQTLSADLGDKYGGSWLNAEGDTLTVAVTDPAEADRVRAAGAEAEVVTYSENQLNTVMRTLDNKAAAASPDLPGWYVDVSTNAVVLLARPGAMTAARRFAADAGVPTDAIRVIASEEAPRPFFDVVGGEPFLISEGGRCSIGFSVVGGFVTAGHCGTPGNTTVGFNRELQGIFRESSFPGDDFAFVEVNGDWEPQPIVNDFDGGAVTVAGSAEAPVGASICRSGSTTGARCGVILAKNATVRYPEGVVTGMVRTDVCAEPGDSGGSWISGDQAQGITSGGSGDCVIGGTTFFQPINEVLETHDLTLVTTQEGEQAPGPADPPADDCTDHTVVAEGELDGTGDRQTQPDGGFFEARAGDHTACLDGPDGASFNVLLQRRTGFTFQTVARLNDASPGDQLEFSGPAGIYRYRVESGEGGGGYTLGFSVN